MDFTIEPGITKTLEKIVNHSDLATAHGSGTVEVFSTPAMIAFMEQTAMESVEHLLPKGYVSVGTEINVKHLQATPIGMKVTCHAKLAHVENRKLIFEVSASDSKGEIGIGTHTRFIVEKKRFLEKLGY